MGSDAPKTQTTTQNTAPWAAAQPYLTEIMKGAQTAYQGKAGATPYSGTTVAPFSGATQGAFDKTLGIAGQNLGGQAATNAIGTANGILSSGGLNSGQTGALGQLGDIASGANKITTGGQYQGLLNAASGPTSSATNLAGLADKANVGILGSDYLKGQEFANSQASDALTRSLGSAGRYGGNAATANAFATTIGGQNAQQNAAELARQQQMMMSANGQIDASNQASYGTRANILGGLTNTQGQNIANQAGAAQSVFNGNQQGTDNQATFAGLLPTLQAAQYGDIQAGQQVGAAQDAQAQNVINSNIAKYDQTNNSQWTLLQNYLATLSGASGGYNSTKTQTPVQQGSTAGGILGGALGGAAAGSTFGPWGTGIGALGGGILGALR
jgi:hypothetical protein